MLLRDVNDTRSDASGGPRVVQLAAGVLERLAQAVGAGFCVMAAAIIPDLLPFLSSPSPVGACARSRALASRPARKPGCRGISRMCRSRVGHRVDRE